MRGVVGQVLEPVNESMDLDLDVLVLAVEGQDGGLSCLGSLVLFVELDVCMMGVGVCAAQGEPGWESTLGVLGADTNHLDSAKLAKHFSHRV